MFLTRGDLWLSWEHGLKLFLNYLIDADWSVCAGNWMWVSSSAFEKSLALDNTQSVDPGVLAYRVDPEGEYVRKYLPQLARMPVEFIHEPWRALMSVQIKAGCIIGKLLLILYCIVLYQELTTLYLLYCISIVS